MKQTNLVDREVLSAEGKGRSKEKRRRISKEEISVLLLLKSTEASKAPNGVYVYMEETGGKKSEKEKNHLENIHEKIWKGNGTFFNTLFSSLASDHEFQS